MEDNRGRLTITVKNALQLPVVKHHPSLLKKFAPKMNPYVVFKLGSESQQTRTDEGGHRAPVWNDKLVFNVMPGLGDLEVKVMHRGALSGRDTEIAYGSIASHMLQTFRGQDHRINVTGPGDASPSGSIAISALFEPEQEVRKLEAIKVQQLAPYRSSSVESGHSRQGMKTKHSGQGALNHANSQRMSNEAPGWLAGPRLPSSSLTPAYSASPRQGHEDDMVQGISGKSGKKSKWGISHLIGYGKGSKDSNSEDKHSQQSSQHEEGLPNRGSTPEAALQSPQLSASCEEEDTFVSPEGSPSQYDRLAAKPSARLSEPGYEAGRAGRGDNPNFASPERIPPQLRGRKESGLRLYPAEEGPYRSKSKWLDDWERGRADPAARRVTESALPDSRGPASEAPAWQSRRRVSETHERPSAPLMEAPMRTSPERKRDPQHAHLKSGREVKEWHEFDGPVPPNYKLPAYLNAMVDGTNGDVHWDMSAKNNRHQTISRERETQWQRQSSEFRDGAHSIPVAEGHPIEDAIQAMRVSRRTAEQSMAQLRPDEVHTLRASSNSGAEPCQGRGEYPQPTYDGPMTPSISDRFGGFGQPSDKPFFSGLTQKDSYRAAPSPSPPETAKNGHQGTDTMDAMSLPPMYPSPFGDQLDANSIMDAPVQQNVNNLGAVHSGFSNTAASTRPAPLAGGTVPFAEIKDRLEQRNSDSASLREKDLSTAMASLQSEIPNDDWRIDENQLAIAVDSKGNPARLGKGSFGEVYKGTLYFQPVAIKVLEVDSQKTLKDALDEMKVLGHLRSTCIVQFLGYTFTEEVDPETQTKIIKKVNLVTELMDGNLWEALGRGRFLWHAGGNKIIKQVCQGLYLLHHKKTMHLDLKSPNILLGNNQAKIADFGMASVVGMNNIRGTIKGMGTYAWASPEMLLGNRPVTDKADVFSLGVILWEICTGERPQRGTLRMLEEHEAPTEINELIKRSVNEDIDSRPTALEFLQTLEQFVPS